MKWTNQYNLPVALCRAIEGDAASYRRRADLSVTDLINPARIVWLTRRYRDEIEEDYADNIWRLLGSAVHYMLYRAAAPNAIQEERLIVSVNSITVSGKPDMWEDRILTDWKVTSTWSAIGELKKEWEGQLNLYRVLYEDAGFPVEKLQIIAILRDWQKGRAKQGGDYPVCPVEIMPVPLWDKDDAEMALEVAATTKTLQLQQNIIPLPCTAEERWAKPDTWAVMKRGNKKASKLFDDEDTADAWRILVTDSEQYYIEHRPGRNVRCEDYCNVNKWCDFWQQQQKEEL